MAPPGERNIMFHSPGVPLDDGAPGE